MLPDNLSRRAFIQGGLALGFGSISFPTDILALANKGTRYPIGACDWSIGKTSDVEAFNLARGLGLDGLQVSLGSVGNNMHLRQPDVQRAFLDASENTKVKIASLAIGELNNVPYKSESVTQEWVHDAIDVANALGCGAVLLAFFHHGDLRDDPKGKKEVVRKLRELAPKAERQQVFLAIESWLSAEEHLEIIEAVGSSHIRVYYDVANSTERGYDIFKEMRLLGTRYICEVHAKENGQLLGRGRVDFEKVKETLSSIGYEGWVVMEGAVPAGQDMFASYVKNREFLEQLLNG